MLRGLRDSLGWLLSSFPFPRQQLVNSILRVVRNLRDDVAEPGVRVDIVEAAGLDQRIHGGRTVTAAVRAAEGPVPAPDSNRRVILPMSGNKWNFITDGILIMAAVSDMRGAKSEPAERSFGLRSSPVRLSRFRRGCWIERFARTWKWVSRGWLFPVSQSFTGC